MDEHITALNALKVVYQNFVDISHYDFEQYGQSITTNLKAFRRLMYLDPTLTVRQVYPLNRQNLALYGTALQDNHELAKLAENARKQHQQLTSGLLTFQGHTNTLLSIIPIFRNNRDFLGYAVGEISIRDLWEPISHTDFLQHYDIQIDDPNGPKFLSPLSPDRPDRMITRVKFYVSDQPWSLLLQPKQSITKILMLQRLSLWCVGFVILFLIYFIISASRQYKLNLDKAHQQFEVIFNASPDGILMLGEKLKTQAHQSPHWDLVWPFFSTIEGQNVF